MTIRLSDTSPAAQTVLDGIYARMTPEHKLRIVLGLFDDARRLHAAGVRARNPRATQREVHEAWLRAILDPELFEKIRGHIDAMGS